MFRAIISSILDALDCVYSLWYNAPTMMPAGDQNGVELWYKAPKMLPAGDQDEVELSSSVPPDPGSWTKLSPETC